MTSKYKFLQWNDSIGYYIETIPDNTPLLVIDYHNNNTVKGIYNPNTLGIEVLNEEEKKQAVLRGYNLE